MREPFLHDAIDERAGTLASDAHVCVELAEDVQLEVGAGDALVRYFVPGVAEVDRFGPERTDFGAFCIKGQQSQK